jgi:hypothetical protein
MQKKGGADNREVYAMKVLQKNCRSELIDTELRVFEMIAEKKPPFLVNLHHIFLENSKVYMILGE